MLAIVCSLAIGLAEPGGTDALTDEVDPPMGLHGDAVTVAPLSLDWSRSTSQLTRRAFRSTLERRTGRVLCRGAITCANLRVCQDMTARDQYLQPNAGTPCIKTHASRMQPLTLPAAKSHSEDLRAQIRMRYREFRQVLAHMTSRPRSAEGQKASRGVEGGSVVCQIRWPRQQVHYADSPQRAPHPHG
jgi:hypothetical protein